MASKVYTAQEMREAANFFMRNSKSIRQKVMSNSMLANIHESTAMLRQAAEMRERCEREIARLPYPPNGEDVYMFKVLKRILCGDAWKEDR